MFSHKHLKKVTRLLTIYRLSDYSSLPAIPDDLNDEMLRLAKTLTNKILVIKKPKDIKSLMQNYEIALNEILSSGNREKLAHHTAQLLQYYTILCEQTDLSALDTKSLHNFLKTNSTRFGTTAKNLFLIEYETIKIYNDLWLYHDAIKKQIPFGSDMSVNLDFIEKRILELTAIVEELKKTYTDNIFCDYLHFSLHYTAALLVKVESCLRQRKLSPEEAQQYDFGQKFFLTQAFRALSFIKEHEKKAEENQALNLGEVFFLGQDFSQKYPHDELEKNIASILKA